MSDVHCPPCLSLKLDFLWFNKGVGFFTSPVTSMTAWLAHGLIIKLALKGKESRMQVIPRPTSDAEDTGGTLCRSHCSCRAVVHDERDPAVDSSRKFDRTELDPIPRTWSPGDEPGDPVNGKSYHTSSPPCSLSCLPGAKVLDKITWSKNKY